MTTWTNFTRSELRDDPSNPDSVQECKLRRAACAFLSEAGGSLKMPQLTIATATIFFHRFFAIHSMKNFDKDAVSMTCLFLAGKVEETPRKLKNVIDNCWKILHNKNINEKDKESEEYLRLREQVLLHEFLLLQTLEFDLTIEHPYKHLLVVMKYLKADKELAQFAWNFVNDSLRTTVCLQYAPNIIALACIYLAAKYRRSILGEGRKWWTEHAVTLDQLHDISSQILELYENSPDMESLRKGMEKDKEIEPHSTSSTISAVDQHLTPNASLSSPKQSSDKHLNLEKHPTSEKYQNSEKYQDKHPSSEKHQNLEKYRRSHSPSNTRDRRSLSPRRHDGRRN